MFKIIKNIILWLLRITGSVVEYSVLLIFILSFLIRTSSFQTWLAQLAAGYLSSELNTTITIDKVDIRFFTSVDLESFYIEDLHGDTLVYAQSFSLDINSFTLSGDKLRFSEGTLQNPRINLVQYKGEDDLNFQFIADYFASEEKDTSASTQHILFDRLSINSGYLSLLNQNDTSVYKGINFSDLKVKNLYLTIDSLLLDADTTSMNIVKLRMSEQSGFELASLQSKLTINPLGIYLKDLSLITNNSELHTEYLEFAVDDFSDFNSFEELVRMKAHFLEPSRLNLSDLAYFVPDLWGIDHDIELHGKIRGTVSNLKTKDLFMKITDNSYFTASIDLTGLPDIDNTFIAFSIDELHTSKKELETIRIPPFSEDNYLELPSNFGMLGEIEFSGSFMGFISDFVAYGDLKTDIGRVKTDIVFKHDTITNNLGYKGRLETYNFNLGAFYSIPDIGSVTANVAIDTAYGLTIENLHAKISGEIAKMDMNGYSYSNMRLKGEFENDFFFGDLKINDPNLDLTFIGDIDFRKKVPAFDFTAAIDGANLVALNLLSDQDISASLCAKIKIKAEGDNIDNFSGRIEIEDVSYYESGIDYEFGDIVIETYESGDVKNLSFNSDFMYAEAYGKFHFESLGNNFQFMASGIMPALFRLEGIEKVDTEENFDMTIRFDRPDIVTSLFLPELELSAGTEFFVQYNSLDDEMKLTGHAHQIKYNAIEINKFVLDVEKQADFVLVNLGAGTFSPDSGTAFDHLKITLLPYQDQVGAAVKWHNDNTNWGDINLEALVHTASMMDLTIKKSSFSVDSLEWVISERTLAKMDSTAFLINPLTLHSGNRSVCLNGKISENQEDILELSLNNINLDLFNPLLPDNMQIQGIMQGDASVGNVYSELYFSSDLQVKNLKIDKYDLGNLTLSNEWNNKKNTIQLDGILEKNGRPNIDISGRYYPMREGSELSISGSFDEMDLEVLNVFLPQEDFSELKGKASGKLSVLGGLEEPLLSGMLDFKDGQMKVNYLNTTYTFSGKVGIAPDMFTIDYMPIGYRGFTRNGKKQKAYLSGSLIHHNFKNMSYDVFMDFEQMLLMNTNYEQNPYFYGNAFGTGYLTFFGYDDNMEITVNVKTENGTKVYLPLYGSSDVVMQDFVTFSGDSTQIEEEYKVDLTGITMNLEMDITQDAAVEIQFDPAIGDVMTGVAEGHLSMSIDQLGDFKMLGGLEVMKGEYLFTLYNIVNKKFNVKPGGTIKWETGSPYDATVDLAAIYGVKASLRELMIDDPDKYSDIVPVNCYMNLKEDLFNPVISFDIDVPKADGNVEAALNRIRQDEAELNKQMFSLMVINQFATPGYATGASASTGLGGAMGATTVEMLNNQLSNWLSNISKEFDLGFNYQPGDAISNDEVALAFETQLLDDKLVLSGNFGVSYGSANTQNPNQLIGDFNAEYKIDNNTRVRAFNQSNDFDATRQSQAPYTQGVGIYYRKEFNTLRDIGWVKKVFGDGSKKKERKEQKKKKKQGEVPEPSALLPERNHYELGKSIISTISNP